MKALKELINNWTMEEFVEFVDRIEKEVDKLDLQEGTEIWQRCEEVRAHCLSSVRPGT